MDTVASSTVPADTPLGSVLKASFTDSPSSSSASLVALKVKVLAGLRCRERHAGRHARVVRVRCSVLVGPAQRHHHLALRRLVQFHRDGGRASLRRRVRRRAEAHLHVGHVRVRDIDRGLVHAPRRHPVRQRVAEAQLHRLPVVVVVIVRRREREGPGWSASPRTSLRPARRSSPRPMPRSRCSWSVVSPPPAPEPHPASP